MNNTHPTNTLTNAAQHMAERNFSVSLIAREAYNCHQMADQRSIEVQAFTFSVKTFAYRILAQGLSKSMSGFSNFLREYLGRVVKADQGAYYADDIGIAPNDADHLIKFLRATFESIRKTGLKVTMHKIHFGATEIDFLERTTAPDGVKPQKGKSTIFLEITIFPMSKKDLQQYLGFLN